MFKLTQDGLFPSGSPSRLGKLVLTAVLIAVPVLMFLPRIISTYDAASLSRGERIIFRSADGIGMTGGTFVERRGDGLVILVGDDEVIIPADRVVWENL